MTEIRCPTSAAIQEFLEVFDRLAKFEGQQRYIRKYGAYSDGEVEGVTQRIRPVIDWLKELSSAMAKEGP